MSSNPNNPSQDPSSAQSLSERLAHARQEKQKQDAIAAEQRAKEAERAAAEAEYLELFGEDDPPKVEVPDGVVPPSSPPITGFAESKGITDAEGNPVQETDSASTYMSTAVLDALIAQRDKYEAERDEYLNDLQRLKGEFMQARKRNAQNAEHVKAQAAAGLAEKLLPVLDSCDIAAAQGIDSVAAVASALHDVLESQGLKRIESTGALFDPELHEAALHEPAEGNEEPVVIETLRAGYLWNDKVLRAAMVKVRG